METVNTTKRNRVSPRTNAFNQVMTLIDSYCVELNQMNHITPEAVLTALQIVRARVSNMIGTKHTVVKTTTKRVAKEPKIKGKHFVAKFADRVEYVSGKDVSILLENDPVVVVHGPWTTKAGAFFAMEAGIYNQKPTPYGKPSA